MGAPSSLAPGELISALLAIFERGLALIVAAGAVEIEMPIVPATVTPLADMGAGGGVGFLAAGSSGGC